MVSNATIPGLTALPRACLPLSSQGCSAISSATGPGHNRLTLGGLAQRDRLLGRKGDGGGDRGGADMVLFNADPGTVASVTDDTVSAVVSAVRAGKLGLARLVSAVTHILDAKHISLCTAR